MGKFANIRKIGFKNGPRRSQGGFTLVEMLAVMGIMLTMLGMTLPAINDALGSKGRKGAVNILLNTFEQARVAALEQSTNVYVGFADKNIPLTGQGQRYEGFPYTHFIVFRDSNPEIDGPNPPTFIALTKWQSLPKGISFKSGKQTIADGINSGTIAIGATDKFPGITSYAKMPVLKFNNTGTVEIPASTNLWLFVYEGFYSPSLGNDVFTRSRGQGENSGLFERISFARYTGRAQLDVTEI